MRILSVTPVRVTEHELTRRQQRYDRLAPDGVEVHLINLSDTADAPRALDTADQIRASERLLAAQVATVDPASYDALLPDCVLDPFVGEEHALPLPVHGISRLAAHHLGHGAGPRLVDPTRLAHELLGRQSRSAVSA